MMLQIMKIFSYGLYAANIMDILIISFLIYAILMLFKKTRSFFVLIGVIMLAALFVFAKIFDLYLTFAVLQWFFGAFFILLVVLFQEELRRLFEMIAIYWQGIIKKGAGAAIKHHSFQPILHAVTNMAHQKIGALIVFEGKETIDRHLESRGVVLNGKISEQILESLFDPSSPGHDGAVIIKNNLIASFCSHLPLSSNVEEIGRYGTRHNAALGISERADALALVASEEKGTVSYALHGKLTTLNGLDELEKILESFFNENFPQEKKPAIIRWFKKNRKEKIIAFIISFILWFLIVYKP